MRLAARGSAGAGERKEYCGSIKQGTVVDKSVAALLSVLRNFCLTQICPLSEVRGYCPGATGSKRERHFGFASLEHSLRGQAKP